MEPVKFLIVDDLPENLFALEALLRRDGLEILLARSGKEALEHLLVHEVALAFLDVQMPEMDGFELAELMRGSERTKHVPIVFVTAGARDPRRVFKGYESGAVDFLFKPIEPHVLENKAMVFFELARQRRQLAEALRMNEMFVAILGHDLRNPLSAVMMGTKVLKKQLADARHQRVLETMTSSGARMEAMIEQLLDLTRARLAGGQGFAGKRKRVDVGALVRRAVDELESAHPERPIELTIDGDAATTGDADRLLQVFSNLVANALTHGEPSAPVVVTVAAAATGATGGEREVRVSVANRGAIDPALVPVLFDPFRGRHDAAARPDRRGLGLGLFIVQQIARAHGGDVTVTSSEAHGTTFTVTLPRERDPESVAALCLS